MRAKNDLLFDEVQYSRQWWIWAVIIFTCLLTAGIFGYGLVQQLIFGRPFGNNPMSDTALGITAMLVLLFDIALTTLFLAANLKTQVRLDGLHLRYFPFHLSFHKISLENVEKVEAVTYSPLREYGGWGIRYTRKGKAYNPTGNRGVRLHYADGHHLLIGSQKPEELARAVESLLNA